MQLNDLYIKYKNRSVKKIDAETKDIILNYLSSIQEIRNSQDANQFIEILALCRGAQAAMDGEKRNNTFRTLLSTGEEGAYVENNSYINERFMYELIQNVDDCKYKSIDDCKLKIDFDLDDDIIKLEYNEIGFKPKDVIAISDIGNSTKNHHKSLDQKETGLDKNDLQEIGEKGIGFKSIFGLANKVSIKSGYFNFYFDYADFTIPKIPSTSDNKKVEGTLLTVFLKRGIAKQLYKMLQNKYQKNSTIITENPVLFLNKLTEIIYCSNDGYFGFRVTRKTADSNINGELMYIEYLSSIKEKQRVIKCYHYSKEVVYSIGECKSRFGEDEDKERTYKIEIITSADLSDIFEGRIYSFFPTEQKLTVPIIIHAPFKLDSARTNIANQSDTADSSNLWFVRTKNETISFIRYVYEDLAKKIGFKIVNFIPEDNGKDKDNLIDSNRCPLFDSRLTRRAFLGFNLFESIDGDYLPADKLYYLNKSGVDLDEIIEIYNLLNLNKPLLKKEITANRASYYGFHRIDGIDDTLFDIALKDANKTEQCLKYLKDYSPNEFKGNFKYILNESQVIQFTEYPQIINFINNQTTAWLKHDDGIKFESDYIFNNKDVDLETLREYCREYSNHLSSAIVHYIDSISCIQDDLYDSPIFLTNHIYASKIVEALNELLGRIDKKYKNFFYFIKLNEIEKEINNLAQDNNLSDDEFLKKITDIRMIQKRILGSQYKNIPKLINESGTKPHRFLMELLQNIDDVSYINDPYVDISYHGNELVLTYNETGFSKENVVAITAIGDSTKQYLKNENTTGEKGIGFKSIFNVANVVEIHSNNYHFKLFANEPTIPKKIKFKEITKGTVMIIDVKNGYIDQYFNDKFLVEICLCLKQIKHLKINGKEMVIHELPNQRIIQYKKKYVYYKFVYEYKVEDELIRKERYDNVEANEKQKITYLVPLEKQECSIYSTFPTSQLMKVPVVIDANLKLNTSRELILKDNRWNELVIKKIHDGFLWMLENIKKVDYDKMMDIIPYDGFLTKEFSYNHKLDEKIRNLQIFKVYNSKNNFISLKDGFIGTGLDKYIIDTWGYSGNKQNSHVRDNCIDFDISKISDDEFYEERDFVDFCEDLYNPQSYDIIHPKYLQDDTFRELLYEYLSKYDDDYIRQSDFEEIGLNNWEIIPVLYNKATKYIKFSNNIYYSDKKDLIIPNTVYILDQSKMTRKMFDKIYRDSDPHNYMDIHEYSESVLLDDIVKKINEYNHLWEPIKVAKQILNLYKRDSELFKECIKRRKEDLKLNHIFLITRTNRVLQLNACYITNESTKESILDNVIVSDVYLDLAKALSVPCIREIDNVDNIHEYFNYNTLKSLFDLPVLKGNKKFFNKIYLSMFCCEYNEYIENEVFLELMENIDVEIAKNDDGDFKNVTTAINANCLCNYGQILVSIYTNYSNLRFELNEDIVLKKFDHYDLLNDIRNDLQTRKLDDKIKQVNSLIEHCFYFKNLDAEIIPLRISRDDNFEDILLIDQNITSEYDIIENFKKFFLSNFSLLLNVTREAERYTRDYFESISTIDYNDLEEKIATQRAISINYDDVSEIKDFMCKPLRINDKVIGGYARTCPICGVKVQTELTGMRLYRLKNEDEIFEFISCPNCYESLRYSSNITIDGDDLKKGFLTFKAIVCGEEWGTNHVKVRLGHKAILNVRNNKK